MSPIETPLDQEVLLKLIALADEISPKETPLQYIVARNLSHNL